MIWEGCNTFFKSKRRFWHHWAGLARKKSNYRMIVKRAQPESVITHRNREGTIQLFQYTSPKLCLNPFHKHKAAANLLSSATLFTIDAQSMFILIESRITGLTKSFPAIFTSTKFDCRAYVRLWAVSHTLLHKQRQLKMRVQLVSRSFTFALAATHERLLAGYTCVKMDHSKKLQYLCSNSSIWWALES